MLKVWSLLLVCLTMLAAPVWAEESFDKWNDDPSTLSEGDIFKTRVELIHPAQFSVGMAEVRRKAEEIRKLDKEERRKHFKKDPVLVVVGPGGKLYAIDGHHECRAFLETGHSKLYAKVVKNWRTVGDTKFWELMKANNFVYLFDENGNGPYETSELPASMKDLKDDPYRSLAGMVRREGGYEKSTRPFAEFRWAQFYRQVFRQSLKNALSKTVTSRKIFTEAMTLAEAPIAAGLPGFKGKLTCREAFAD